MLELRNVTKTFNLTGAKEDLRIALDNVSLQIDSGEFVTVIGGNGSGKSTTMNIITGALKPDSGSVRLNDVDITKMTEYQRASYFGRVFQDPMMGTAADMSVIENLEIAYRRGHRHSLIKWGFVKANREIFINELKRFDLGLETRLNQKVGVMSGGQRQALTLIMASLRSKPSYRTIKRDYIKFCEKNRTIAEKEFNDVFMPAKEEYKRERVEIKPLMPGLKVKYKDDKACLIKNFKKSLKENLEVYKSKGTEIANSQRDVKEKRKLLNENKLAYVSKREQIKKDFKEGKIALKLALKKPYIEAFERFDAKVRKFDLTKQILLLDEHTAALDPKTAKKVLELTEKIVRENQLTTLMITHNMKDAITYGDRLVMFHMGHIILDVKGEEKKKLTVEDLLKKFDEADKLAGIE